ncbi:F-box/LRR-repeat protein At5g63520 [Ziziphus jujuba]|uniref:F-box/LRR-repeat protein At5g63520 n=2 Tax=Ziziphus jujuba TaxID=326968 RepID=A0A6P3ZRW5_ZIZJJ|nr:F-box/LRR-repeat protein At5g63520 [Ziziphus jujuba]KAH7528202.1 hypothetical protein FEM48_Zijuj05G0047300 [Ziziphus jujuba var. spinosa]
MSQMEQQQALATASLKGNRKRQTTPFAMINDDLLLNILSRLPAVSFASAACVNKYWNGICNRVLSRPKLSSALSLNPSPEVAVGEVLDEVLAEPIRPHFAIANVGGGFRLAEVLRLMSKKLGSKTPIIVTTASGIIGRDARTGEFKEAKLMLSHCYDLNWDGEEDEDTEDTNGIVLTVGFVPGLKVDAIPLLQPTKELRDARIEKFVMDIRDFTSSASGSTTPVGIIMFGEGRANMKPILNVLDFAMPLETVILGNERSRFLYRSESDYKDVRGNKTCFTCAIALVFANDKDKSCGIGNIQFNVALSNGLSTIGPKYKAASVKVNSCDHTTWLTARAEGNPAVLDGQRILDDINRKLENRSDAPDLYIGVTTRRNFSIGSKKPKLMTSLTFHGVVGGDEEYLYVDGIGIKTGDYFQFYHSDPATALSSCSEVTMKLKDFKSDKSSKNVRHMSDFDVNRVREEVFGGLIFGCYGRGESFFKRPNIDSSPFLENFPGVPVAGVFCGGEIGRSSSSMTGKFHKDSDSCCCLHVYSTVYLVMSYTPSELEY